MRGRARICFMLAALLLSAATLAVGTKDPELDQCTHQCRSQRLTDERQIESCIQRCEDYDRQKHGGGDDLNDRSPIQRLRECNKDCERRQQGREECQSRCQQTYERETERYEERGREEREKEHHGGRRSQDREREQHGSRSSEGREREEISSNNPYVFEDRHFVTGMQSQHGRFRVLQKFTDRSELHRGIENFRIAVLETQPETFVVPNHIDADVVVFVAKGRGAVSMVREERRESFNIREGDIFRIRAGTTTYLVNKDNNERLVLAKIIQPVNTPGNFEEFFGAGGENPESYFKAFSNEILEAAFNVKGDRVRKLFGQQKQGAIIKASPEQIRSLSQHQEGGIWPFGGESKGTHNIYDKRPTHDNEFGQYYEVDSTQFRQLRDLDIAISLTNLTRGAMTAPFYNSKATKIAIVVEGEGYFEMACPHLSRSQSQGQQEEYYHHQKPYHRSQGQGQGQGQGQSQTGYQKVRSRLRTGTVVVVPAGHPFVAVASNDQNLQILSFKVNAYNNEQFVLAGKRNVMNQLEREAKELAFGVPAREVEEVFRSQKEEFFFQGPGRRAEA